MSNQPTLTDIRAINAKYKLKRILDELETLGYEATVTQVPLQPLAMGNKKTVVEVHKRRGCY